jgi:hypothetical protein
MHRQIQLHALSILILELDQKKADILATYLPSNSVLYMSYSTSTAFPCILATVTALLHFHFVIGFDKGEVCNAGMSGEQAAIQIHTSQVHALPVSSVNVASGEADVPDLAVDLKRKLKSLPVYQLC